MTVDDRTQYYWDSLFSEPDPWSYDDSYESTKRAYTLTAVPAGRVAQALEIGCAEGHFTLELARIADRVVALEISRTALARAEKRCRALNNVRFEHGDAFKQLPRGSFDLITCMEVLYYAKNRFVLGAMARRIASHLKVGGHVILTHANSVTDNREETGFDFHEIGAAFIERCFARVRTLQLIVELRTEFYRIQVFQKTERRRIHGQKPPQVLLRKVVLGNDDRAARIVKRGGCAVTQAEARYLWCSPEINVLMYHRIARTGPDGLAAYRVTPEMFERQLAYLQRNGFQSLSVEEAVQSMNTESRTPAGRAVVLTFDDAYKDFYECAWPLLRRYGFGATVFVPVTFVGQHAQWDRAFGEPAALMSWDELRALQRAGIRVGSHALTHRRLTGLGSEELKREVEESADVLMKRLGVFPSVFCYPYGYVDEQVRRAVEAAGYEYAVVGFGRIRRGENRYLVPRQEILGHRSMEDFVRLLGGQRRAPLMTQLKYRWRHLWRDRRTYMDI